jgi:flagellar biosynthesis/type III secretory pathway protein FliH
MSEQANEQTTAEAPPSADTGERLDRLEGAVGRIEQALGKLVPTGTRADSEQRVQRRLEAPSTVEDQVRAELAKARREEADQAAAAGKEETLNQRLAKLEERPPAPPVKRATKMLGWGGR